MLPKVTMQPVHRIGKGGLLVVHRDHHVEHGHAGGASRHGGVRPRFEVDAVTQRRRFEGDVCHDTHASTGSLCSKWGQAMRQL